MIYFLFSSFLLFSFLVYGQDPLSKSSDATVTAAPQKTEVPNQPQDLKNENAQEKPVTQEGNSNLKKTNFVYDENEGRDPFKKYVDPKSALQASVKLQSPTESEIPVEQRRTITTAILPIDVQLVGVIYGPPNSVALFKVNGAKGIARLRTGAEIGRFEGRILKIKKDSVDVEQIKLIDGQRIPEKLTFELRTKKN